MDPLPFFSPPLHSQRHTFVIDYVLKNKPVKVVDLGCCECTLLQKLRFHHAIQLLVGVDIDAATVKKKIHELTPLSTDYLQPTFDQLRIELYEGSVTQKDARLKGFDLVTSIELIEHLSLADVEGFSEVVFGYMTPVAVIVSTPNSEFNPLFPGLTGFRHSDHKFEWTRAEFRSWALKVCLRYGYEVEFTGVGQAPPGTQQSVGFCSQIGVFRRINEQDGCNVLFSDDSDGVFPYTLLKSIEYPSLRDNNILRKVLVSEVLYWAEQMKTRWIEGFIDRSDIANTLYYTEDGEGDCDRVSELCTAMEDKLTAAGACGAEMQQCGRVESEDQEGEDGDVLRTNTKGQEEFSQLRRCVSVPLAVLWAGYPKVSAWSGSLSNLRLILMEDTKVKLSQDGSALLLYHQEQEEEEDDDLEDDDFEASGCTEASQCYHSAEEEEDWEAYV